MPQVQPKMVNYLDATYIIVEPDTTSAPAVPHYGRTDIAITNAIQSATLNYPQNTGEFLYDLPNYNPAAPAPAIPTNLAGPTGTGLPCGVKDIATRDIIIDDVSDSEVRAVLTRRIYTGGMTITGLNVEYIGQICPELLTQLRYIAATGTLQISVDGGATWAGAVGNVLPLADGDALAVAGFVPGSGVAYVYLSRDANPLPVVDTVSTLTMDISRWGLIYMVMQTTLGYGAISKPYRMPANVNVQLAVPIIFDFGTIPAHLRLYYMYEDIANKDVVLPPVPGSGFTAQGDVAVIAQNTLDPLPAIPLTPANTLLYVNGVLLRYGSDYTLAGAAITIIPATLGYNIETTDWVRALVQ